MAVTIGARPEHGFDQPLALLSDCHRRIERFLETLLRVTAQSARGELTPRGRAGLEVSLRYFREAAPRHTADEEDSLFPRLSAAVDPRAGEARAAIARLQAQHGEAAQLHAEVEVLGRRWLADGRLRRTDLDRLGSALVRLRAIYEEHIAVEDHGVFPLAAQVLAAEELAEVGREMAARRGHDPDVFFGARP